MGDLVRASELSAGELQPRLWRDRPETSRAGTVGRPGDAQSRPILGVLFLYAEHAPDLSKSTRQGISPGQYVVVLSRAALRLRRGQTRRRPTIRVALCSSRCAASQP